MEIRLSWGVVLYVDALAFLDKAWGGRLYVTKFCRVLACYCVL